MGSSSVVPFDKTKNVHNIINELIDIGKTKKIASVPVSRKIIRLYKQFYYPNIPLEILGELTTDFSLLKYTLYTHIIKYNKFFNTNINEKEYVINTFVLLKPTIMVLFNNMCINL